MTRHYLSDKVVAGLMRTLQHDQVVATNDDGEDVYLDAGGASDALCDLVDMFWPVIDSWPRSEDEKQAAMEAIILSLRTMVITDTPVEALLRGAKNAIYADDRNRAILSAVHVPQATRYEAAQLLRATGGDGEAAYTALSTGELHSHLTPATFYAAIRAMQGSATMFDQDILIPDHSDTVIADIVVHTYLLPALEGKQAFIIRGHYGLRGVTAQEAWIMAEAGYGEGEPIDDRAMSSLLHSTEPAVRRARARALAAMRGMMES